MPRTDLSTPVPVPSPPRSVWRDHPARATYPALDADVDCDVVVVGAGLVGLTTALLLAREGVRVTVLEAREVGAGCTGHSSAKVSVVHGMKAASLRSTHGEDVARTYLRANTAGMALLRSEAAGIAGAALETRAAIVWSESEQQVAAVREEAAALRACGVTAQDLSGEDVTALGLPGPAVAGFRVADQAQVDPAGLLAGLAEQVDAHEGCAVHERTRVTEVDDVLRRDRPRVHAAGGTVTADHVVLATQVPFLDRGLWFARLEPYRSHQLAVRVEATPPEDMLLREGGGATRSLRTAPDPDDPSRRVLLVGGDGHKTGQGGDTRRHVEALASFAHERFGLREVLAQWAAQDYTPLDGLPSVGAGVAAAQPHVRGHRLLQVGHEQRRGRGAGAARPRARPDQRVGRPVRPAPARAPRGGQDGRVGERERREGHGHRLGRRGRARRWPRRGRGRGAARGAAPRRHVPGRRHRLPRLRRVPAPRWRAVVERRGALVGLPAARVPVLRRRAAAAGPGDRRPVAGRLTLR